MSGGAYLRINVTSSPTRKPFNFNTRCRKPFNFNTRCTFKASNSVKSTLHPPSPPPPHPPPPPPIRPSTSEVSTSLNNHVWFSYAWCTPQGSERVQVCRHSTLVDVRRKGFSSGWTNLSQEASTRGLKAGGSLHPLLASDLASPLLLGDRRHAENRCRWRGRRYHHQHRLQYRRRIRSSDHATRLQLPSPHRQLSPDQHQHQRLPWHRLRRKPEKSLQHQTARSRTVRTTTRKSTRSTRSTTGRTL